MVLRHAIYENGPIIDAIKLISHSAVGPDLSCAGREFGDHNPDRRRRDDKAAVRLLDVKSAPGVVVGLAAGVDLDRAIGRLRKVCAYRRINFLILAINRLIVDAVVVVIRDASDVERKETKGEHGESAAKSKVVPATVAMEVHINIAMHADIGMDLDSALGRAIDFNVALRFDPVDSRTVFDGSFSMADAAMKCAINRHRWRCAGRGSSVRGGGSVWGGRGSAASSTEIGREQRERGEQCGKQGEKPFKIKVRFHFDGVL